MNVTYVHIAQICFDKKLGPLWKLLFSENYFFSLLLDSYYLFVKRRWWLLIKCVTLNNFPTHIIYLNDIFFSSLFILFFEACFSANCVSKYNLILLLNMDQLVSYNFCKTCYWYLKTFKSCRTCTYQLKTTYLDRCEGRRTREK